MIKVKDITAAIEAFAPLSVQESWDNSGLLIGSQEDTVHGVLIGFDCTPELVDEAAAGGYDLIVTHHPLIFKGLRRISPEDPDGLAVLKAIRAGIAVYATHTASDKVLEGVSGIFAGKLGLQDVRILEPDADGEHGLGVIGRFPVPHTFTEIRHLLKKDCGVRSIRSSKPLHTGIQTVAICGGSGGSLIGAARRAGADLYISADISYHNFFTPHGFMLMDIGHFESEIGITEILFTLIKKNFPTFAVRISEKLNNPIIYY